MENKFLELKQKKFIIGILIAAVLCLIIVGFAATREKNPYSDIDIESYVKVADYNDIKIKKETVEISSEELEDEINRRLEEKTTVKNVTEGTVADGDTVNIDYTGSIDGVKFDGGEEEDKDLTIGSGEFIEGFEEGLIGAEVGTTKNVKVTFPEDYSLNPDLAGKNAIFAIKINSKEVKEVPELDEAFVKENSDVETVKEYKKLVKSQLQEEKEKYTEEQTMYSEWSKFIEECKMKEDSDGNELYPEERLNTIKEETMAFYEEVANSSNMSVEDYAEQMFGMDKETFEEQIDKYSKIVVKEELVTYYIAEKEGIEVSSEEYDKYIEDILAQYSYTEESFAEAYNGKTYEEVEGKDKIKAAALKQKVQKFILETGYSNYEKSKESKEK